MGPGNCGVRRVVVGNVVLMLLHFYFEARAQPQPSPSSPFVDFIGGDVGKSYLYFTVKGRVSAAANGTRSGNMSYEPAQYKDASCTIPLPPSFSVLYWIPTTTEYTCFHSTPIQLKVDNATSTSVFSFTSKFLVTMSTQSDGGPSSNTSTYNDLSAGLHGFTFALLPLDFNQSDAGDGGYLGLLNATSNGNNQSHTVAVEFDFKGNPEFSDPVEGYHIAVNINSMNSTSWTLLPGPTPSFQSWGLQVWIDYDGSSHMLTVTTLDVSSASTTFMNTYCVSDEERPPARGPNSNVVGAWTSHSQKVDLSSVLNEFMYVGFTSSSLSSSTLASDMVSSFEIYSWSFRTSNSSPPAPSAPLRCPSGFFPKDTFVFTLTLVLSGLLASSVVYATSYMYYSRWVEKRGWRFNIDGDDLGASDPHKFTYKELALATKSFDEKHALGRGGFGSVYKGFLPGNKQDVAVKRVSAESKQGEREFLAEVMIIGKLRHRNLVRLQGWCHERGELLLVYDYMPNGSVDKLLFGNHVKPQDSPAGRSTANRRLDKTVSLKDFVVDVALPKFPWERRFKVIVDVATALVYLHTECEERIIHRDVKAANVMLDAKFNARLGDFGLARAYNHSLLTPESTNVAGTFGYLAPELFHTGKQTEKTDVYSFGAFLLEVACGRNPIFHEGDELGVLVDHVWRLWGDSKVLDSADPQLQGMFDEGEMATVLCLGLLCSHPSPVARPSMRQVLCILAGDTSLPDVPSAKPRAAGDHIHTSFSQDLLTRAATAIGRMGSQMSLRRIQFSSFGYPGVVHDARVCANSGIRAAIGRGDCLNGPTWL